MPATLLLSGWTQPADALAPLADAPLLFDYSEHVHADASFEALRAHRDVPYVIAWSLGAQLALRAIAAGVLAPKHLTLIAPPLQFVSGNGVQGMDPLTFSQFRDNYALSPARTKSRFHGLVAKGDRDFSRILEILSHHPTVEDTARWLPWLDDLGSQTLTGISGLALPPTLVIHGMNDVIVPYQQSEHLASQMPQVTLELWPEVGHAPHVHDATRLRAAIAAHRAANGVSA